MNEESKREDERDEVPATGRGSAEAAGTTGNPGAGAGVEPGESTYAGEGVGRREDVGDVAGGEAVS